MLNCDKILSLNNYLEKIQEIYNTDSNQYLVFRGQSNASWELDSAAARRINRTLHVNTSDISAEIYLDYHEKILDLLKLKGFHIKEGRTLHDLELLAELQHSNAATGLIDFSKNSLIALWFACQGTVKSEVCDITEVLCDENPLCCPYNKKEIDGSVFIMDINNANFSSISYSDLSNAPISIFLNQREGIEPIYDTSDCLNIDEFDGEQFSDYRKIGEKEHKVIWWTWEASHINSRIPVQQSIFLFGKPVVQDIFYKKIVIDGRSKGRILKELKKHYNINYESLFPDFQGFSNIQQSTNEIKVWSKYGYYEIAKEKLKKGEIKEAYLYSTKGIQLPNCTLEAFKQHGKICLKNDKWLEEALALYQKLSKEYPVDYYNYYYIAVCYCKLNALEEARKVLTIALRYAEEYNWRGLCMKCEFLFQFIENKQQADK